MTQLISRSPGSGGNIATVLSLKAAEMSPSIPLVFQLLIAPAVDRTSVLSLFENELKHAPGLNPDDVIWLSRNYLPNQEDRYNWDVSPILAPDELVRNLPQAWIGIMEVDIRRPEGVAYGLKLKEAGVEVQTVVYKGAPHVTMMLSSKFLFETFGKQLMISPNMQFFSQSASMIFRCVAMVFNG